MRQPSLFQKALGLALLCCSLQSCAHKATAPLRKKLAKTEIVAQSTQRLSDMAKHARVVVRLRRNAAERGHDGWSYRLKYEARGQQQELSLRGRGAQQPAVQEAARAYPSDDGDFELKILAVESAGDVPNDVELDLEESSASTASDAEPATLTVPTSLSVANTGKVTWSPVDGAAAYELQWTFVDADDSEASASPFYERPTGTLEVTEPKAELELGYGAGKVYVRVRALAPWPGTASLNRGLWTASAVTSLEEATALEPARNWFRTTRFNNQGTNRTTLKHFDALLRERQQVETSRPLGTTRVTSTVLDDEGRAALSTLPIPVALAAGQKPLPFRPDFVVPVGSTVPMASSRLRDAKPPALATSGAGSFYQHRALGSVAADAEENWLPEDPRPYASTSFARDFRARPSRSSGVGDALHDHPSTFSSGAAGAEFRELFGQTAGLLGNYTRDTSVDPNGQGHVRYTDPEGRLVAIGLVGLAPTQVTDAASSPPKVEPVLSKLDDNPLPGGPVMTSAIDIPPTLVEPGQTTSEYVYALVNSVPTDYAFAYKVNPTTTPVALGTDPPTSVCPHCQYTTKISIVDQFGAILPCGTVTKGSCSGGTYQVTVGQVTSCAPGAGEIAFKVHLALSGEYRVIRRVELDDSAILSFVQEHASKIPGAPAHDDVKTHVDDSSGDPCAISECKTEKCKTDLVRAMARRECEGLEATARAEKQQALAAECDAQQAADPGVACDSNVAQAASFECPNQLCPVAGQPQACCHARRCWAVLDESIKSKLYEIRLAEIKAWSQADALAVLDPLSMGNNGRPPALKDCLLDNCRDPVFFTPLTDHLRTRLEKRLRKYRPDPCDDTTPISLWRYVNLPLFGFDDKTKWTVFRGAYLALRTEVLTEGINEKPPGCTDTPSCCGDNRWCPYNDVVKAPDLSLLNGSVEDIEAAALAARTEHCNSQCEANVCNWRWQLEDGLCPSYHPFARDAPAYVCDDSTPVDEVHAHLLAYCLNRCNNSFDPSGAFSPTELATDPDLLAASAAAGCSFTSMATPLVDPNVVCSQQCKVSSRPTACGELLLWYLQNRAKLKADELRQELERRASKCTELAKLEEQKDRLVLGTCQIWLVDENGHFVSIDDIAGDPSVGGPLPGTMPVELRSKFTGLVVKISGGSTAFILSDCPMKLTGSATECCPGQGTGAAPSALPEAATPTAAEVCANPTQYAPPNTAAIETATANADKVFACVDDKPVESQGTAGDACNSEYLARLAAVLAGGDLTSAGKCTGGAQVFDPLIEIEPFKDKGCWFALLTGKEPTPWLRQDGWHITSTETAPVPPGYSQELNQTADGQQFTVHYTGARLLLVGPDGASLTVYVYSNCGFALEPACTPVGGNFDLNLGDFNFSDWNKECKADAQAAQDTQTERLFEDGTDDATQTWTSTLEAHCMGGNLGETFTVSYQAAEYAHTLFYYDQVGNLTTIVPPKGVNKIPAGTDGSVNASAVPAHGMLTQVEYDTRNNIVRRTSPDAGAATFVYDRRGRRRFAQTADQIGRQEWTYAEYDVLDRVVETGLTGPYSKAQAAQLADVPLPDEARRDEKVTTHYGAADVEGGVVSDDYMRGRPREILAARSGARLSYQYAPSGLVRTFATDQPVLGQKVAHYAYDVVDDVPLALDYQAPDDSATFVPDELRQRYAYDSERRLVSTESSQGGLIWDHDAEYSYYSHGPLRRAVLGEDKVQGLDYVYTIQGWPKAVNAGDASSERDPGGDGRASGSHATVPRDLVGLVFSYFDGDFVGADTAFMSGDTGSGQVFARDGPDLFTGTIRGKVLTHRALDAAATPERSRYNYDQLTRLTDSVLTTTSTTPGVVVAGCQELDAAGAVKLDGSGQPSEPALPANSSCYRYDANGNITLAKNWGNAAACSGNFDRLEYRYDASDNRLLHIDDDTVANNACASDIDDQGTFVATSPATANYGYDAVGRLIRDNSEGIVGAGTSPGITWSSTDKVLSVTKAGAPAVTFDYDGLDRRASKTVGSTTTFYVRHPDGRILATYKTTTDSAGTPTTQLGELVLYAEAKRIGVRLHRTTTETGVEEVNRSLSRYELTDQVGSVLAVLSGASEVATAADYYPFGLLRPGREIALEGARFGFGGYEKDDEFSGLGQNYVTLTRSYDPRTGRWISPDPLVLSVPSTVVERGLGIDPYLYVSNNPNANRDPTGMADEAGTPPPPQAPANERGAQIATAMRPVFNAKDNLLYGTKEGQIDCSGLASKLLDGAMNTTAFSGATTSGKQWASPGYQDGGADMIYNYLKSGESPAGSAEVFANVTLAEFAFKAGDVVLWDYNVGSTNDKQMNHIGVMLSPTELAHSHGSEGKPGSGPSINNPAKDTWLQKMGKGKDVTVSVTVVRPAYPVPPSTAP